MPISKASIQQIIRVPREAFLSVRRGTYTHTHTHMSSSAAAAAAAAITYPPRLDRSLTILKRKGGERRAGSRYTTDEIYVGWRRQGRVVSSSILADASFCRDGGNGVRGVGNQKERKGENRRASEWTSVCYRVRLRSEIARDAVARYLV